MHRRVSSRDDETARTERGSTLIEILVAMSIMSSAVIVLVTGMGTLFANSTQNRQATTAGVVARDYAEALELVVAQPGTFCQATYTVSPLPPPPADYPVTASYGVCPAAGTPQFQTVVVTATAPNGLTENINMVVRQP
jgi:type II secretory pathway pseudopilin PulG